MQPLEMKWDLAPHEEREVQASIKVGEALILDGCQVVVTGRRAVAGGVALDVSVIHRHEACSHKLTGWTTSEAYVFQHGDRI